MKKYVSKQLCWLLISLYSMSLHAQSIPNKLTENEISEIIESVTHLLNSKYVFPDKALLISNVLNQNHAKGAYNTITDELRLAESIQQDILSVVNDKHLSFEFNPEHAALLRQDLSENKELNVDQANLRTMQRFNFGFETVNILEGNIGYLKLNSFHDTEYAAETAIAAMNFLSYADAVIIDLRQNGGGSWKMIQLISSYFFGSEPVHLSGFYWRPKDKYTQNWTLPFVPGKKNPETDIYILISANTFSAAEEFSYNLKHLNRATLIGETTAGGAHPGDYELVNDRFTIFIPYGRSTNPITKTNWEGVGVIPDIKVPAADALGVAKIKALEKLSKNHPGNNGDLYRWYLVSEHAKLNPVKLTQTTLQSYAGNYGPRTLLYDDGQLYYQREGGPKLLLNALEEDLFELAADNSFRMRIIKKDDKVIALQGLFDNGFKDQHSKQDQSFDSD